MWVTANKYLLCSIDVGAEPLAHIVFARDDKHILSCDDEGQLELWSLASGGGGDGEGHGIGLGSAGWWVAGRAIAAVCGRGEQRE